MRMAVHRALIEYERGGDPVVVREDGRGRWLPAEGIVIPYIEDIERDLG